MEMKFSRSWAMPSHNTFSVPPIGALVKRYLADSKVSIDPFARNKNWARYTNDLNPKTLAQHHMDAVEFLQFLPTLNIKADLVILDPPYSPRQISECYKGIGRDVTMKDTQSAAFYKRMRDAADPYSRRNRAFLWLEFGRHGKEERI